MTIRRPMEKPQRKDINEIDEFSKFGDVFKKTASYPDRNIYVFERKYCIEVVKGKKYTNPDGTVVRTYPGSEDFGSYGFCIARNSRFKDRIIDFLVNNPDKWGAQDIYEFKKTLK